MASSGPGYAALEARSMIIGEVALVAYAAARTYCLGVRHMRSAPTAVLLLALALIGWFAISSLLWYVRKHHPWNRP